MNESDAAKRFDCQTISLATSGRRVVLARSAAKEFWKLDVRQQSRFVALMDLWVSDHSLSEAQFKVKEGRVKGSNRMLMAFKIMRVRCYGFECPLAGQRTFVIVDIDPAKKTNKAKTRVLDRAKERVERFEQKYGEHYG